MLLDLTHLNDPSLAFATLIIVPESLHKLFAGQPTNSSFLLPLGGY